MPKPVMAMMGMIVTMMGVAVMCVALFFMARVLVLGCGTTSGRAFASARRVDMKPACQQPGKQMAAERQSGGE